MFASGLADSLQASNASLSNGLAEGLKKLELFVTESVKASGASIVSSMVPGFVAEMEALESRISAREVVFEVKLREVDVKLRDVEDRFFSTVLGFISPFV